MPVFTRPRLTSQERITIAKRLFNHAKHQAGLTEAQRQDARRHAYNLMALNMYEAKKRLGLLVPPARPSSLGRLPPAT